MLTLKNAEFDTKKKKPYVLSSPEIFLSLKCGNLLRPPTPIPGISYAKITQSSMKKVSVVDTATQTDAITIVDPAVQSKTSSNKKTEDLTKTKAPK